MCSFNWQSSYISALQARKAIDPATTSKYSANVRFARSLLMPLSCFDEWPALSHRLADRSRAYSDYTHSILVLRSSVGRHRHILFGSSLPDLEDHGLDYDSRYNCSGK